MLTALTPTSTQTLSSPCSIDSMHKPGITAPHTHTHTHTHTLTHARTHAHTHIHTHTPISPPPQHNTQAEGPNSPLTHRHISHPPGAQSCRWRPSAPALAWPPEPAPAPGTRGPGSVDGVGSTRQKVGGRACRGRVFVLGLSLPSAMGHVAEKAGKCLCSQTLMAPGPHTLRLAPRTPSGCRPKPGMSAHRGGCQASRTHMHAPARLWPTLPRTSSAVAFAPSTARRSAASRLFSSSSAAYGATGWLDLDEALPASVHFGMRGGGPGHSP